MQQILQQQQHQQASSPCDWKHLPSVAVQVCVGQVQEHQQRWSFCLDHNTLSHKIPLPHYNRVLAEEPHSEHYNLCVLSPCCLLSCSVLNPVLSLILSCPIIMSCPAKAISHHCCPATKARLRLACSAWHQALATQFSTLYLGPGNPAAPQQQSASTDHTHSQQQQQQQHLLAWVLGDRLHSAFPAVSALQLVASSSREYADNFTQVSETPAPTALLLSSCHT